ncbi:hypothetical protein O6H91_18G085700 [Diphasiastrum complanatum]|uniref:Uncharacterized protein n=10 Tax=Diphasiastrum complanatum TaxID=34168 RepID=A0ACC2B3F8_DIPCM|nr:hypothetical protein O6H91_18G085700 [Diphasiastrum complanatum]KAJ7524291.1 hypothetical protein O6H91_18G085700 [Diphasiastrum complanatum]KAJ7524292.1 hypothetical protein O6H91_18G085700 [Diphasiastrum complanatum]KAJ7524293.1 hypothetical protein O6H91_18G085700 [Diphasiastrum complanatum]KAJ7524294.1 hypothetical protein O6H91_18G085700 [Diphasiastrum complanatum]
MLKLEANGNNSLGMETHHTIKQSRWLQENLRDVDDRVKTMLELIEGDADSFAQRAEHYYQKRPQLVKEVEGFHRAYRSLAATLIGNMHQNSPKDLQIQSGLSLDSPRITPFGKQLQFKNRSTSGTLKDSGSLQGDRNSQDNDDALESDEHSAEGSHIKAKTSPPSADHEESSASSSDIEYEHAAQPTGKLPQGLLDQKAENKDLVEESKRLAEECDAAKKLVVDLQQEISRLQESNNVLIDETTLLNDRCEKLEEEVSGLLKNKMADENGVIAGVENMKRLEAEIQLLQETRGQNEKYIFAGAEKLHLLEEEFYRLEKEKVNIENQLRESAEKEKASMAALKFMKGELVCVLKKNKKMQEDLANNISHRLTANISLINKDAEIYKLNKDLQDLKTMLSAIHEKVSYLQEDNDKQKILLADISEEKRNAIRQLCFSIEMTKERNSRLEQTICLYKRKFDEFNSAIHRSGWKSLFTNHWM